MKNNDLFNWKHLFQNDDVFYRELNENLSWYQGNPEQLEYFFKTLYNTYEKGARSPYAIAEQQTKFWKTVSGDVPRVHSGLPKLATQAFVNMIAGNGYDINVDGNEEQEERLWSILWENNFDGLLQKAIATESWSGFVFFKISHDLELSDKPIIEVISPFDAKCKTKRGRVQEIIFFIREDYGDTEVEVQERYYLEDDRLKVEYKAFIDNEETDLPDKYREYQTDYPLTFIPAMLKNNTTHNSRFPNYPYGESDFTSVQALFHMLDDLLSQSELEVSNAIAQKFVNQKLIPKQLDGRPYKFNRNETVVEMTSNDMEDDSFDVRKFISILQPDIRVDRYDKMIRDTYARILTNMGLSPVTVGLPNFESIVASQASQREREKSSLRTRSKKLKLWKQALEQLFDHVLRYDDYLNNRAEQEYNVEVDFPQYAMPTIDERIATIGQAVQLNIMSIDKAVQELYQDITDEERSIMVRNIKLENGIPLMANELVNDEGIPQATETTNMIPLQQETQEQPIEEQPTETTQDEVQKDTSYNGAQISSAILIVQEFISGTLSYEAAITMLMEFLKIERPLAEKMINERAKQEAKKAMAEQVNQ
jgi:hypothetical protein